MKTQDPVALDGGTIYLRNSASAALGTVLAPGSNTNGAIIQSCSVGVNGSDGVRVMLKASAPSGWNDAAAKGVLMLKLVTSNGNAVLPYSVYVPAGLGIYEQAQGAGATTNVDMVVKVL